MYDSGAHRQSRHSVSVPVRMNITYVLSHGIRDKKWVFGLLLCNFISVIKSWWNSIKLICFPKRNNNFLHTFVYTFFQYHTDRRIGPSTDRAFPRLRKKRLKFMKYFLNSVFSISRNRNAIRHAALPINPFAHLPCHLFPTRDTRQTFSRRSLTF